MLFGEIDALLGRAGVAVGDISAFASASGRIVHGCADRVDGGERTGGGNRASVVAVSNLLALASFGTRPLRAVAIDARRGEIYGAVYNAALEPVREEAVTKLETLLAPAAECEVELIVRGYPPAEAVVAAMEETFRGRLVEAPARWLERSARSRWNVFSEGWHGTRRRSTRITSGVRMRNWRGKTRGLREGRQGAENPPRDPVGEIRKRGQTALSTPRLCAKLEHFPNFREA